MDKGAFLILEGETEIAASLGFKAGAKRVVVRGVEDVHAPKLQIVWDKSVQLPVFEVPAAAKVFARERWKRRAADRRVQRGSGAVLWVAAQPGEQGYERFPYLLQALADLGFDPPFRSRRLWAFFDPRTARASISITSPAAGARPASPRCTSPPGISTSRTRSATRICDG